MTLKMQVLVFAAVLSSITSFQVRAEEQPANLNERVEKIATDFATENEAISVIGYRGTKDKDADINLTDWAAPFLRGFRKRKIQVILLWGEDVDGEHGRLQFIIINKETNQKHDRQFPLATINSPEEMRSAFYDVQNKFNAIHPGHRTSLTARQRIQNGIYDSQLGAKMADDLCQKWIEKKQKLQAIQKRGEHSQKTAVKLAKELKICDAEIRQLRTHSKKARTDAEEMLRKYPGLESSK